MSIHPHPPDATDGPVVTLVLPTRPAARLRGGDRRRLAHRIAGAERRLARVAEPSPARARTVRRLWALAERAAASPARDGLALVASSSTGRHLPLHHPVTTRTIVGPLLTDEELAAATWAFGRVAVLRPTVRGARLVACAGNAVWEPRPPWDPLVPTARRGVLQQSLDLAETALPARTPLVVAGDDRLVAAVRGLLDRDGITVAATLAGDHSATAPAPLAALAQRALRRSLTDPQRDAMARLALACDRGVAVRGTAAVHASPVGPGDLLIVEEAVLRGAGSSDDARVHVAAGTVAVLPDGFLAGHGRMALVLGHARPPVAAGPAALAGAAPR